ncbi:MAG: stage III sporulation protein AE [Clostridia bacterium]|nr:stage III sporulation protein AE [Clostridia bacterium]
MKKILAIMCIVIILLSLGKVQAASVDTSFEGYIDELSKYTSNEDANIDLYKIATNLKDGKGLSYDNSLKIILSVFFKELRVMLEASLIIVTLIIMSSVVQNVQLEKQSEVIKLTSTLCFITISIVIFTSFTGMLEIFKNTCENTSNIMQVISPFLLGMLIVNGGINSVGIIQPLILFASSLSGFLITNVITPMIVTSVVFSVIGSLNEKKGLLKISSYLRKTAIWTLSIMLTIFLGILTLETSISKDVDSLAVKTTTAAVSNFVPVVGKFFSDSFETVVGASKIITKVGGVVGIIVMLTVAFVPVLKIGSAWIVYNLISTFGEILESGSTISKIILEIAEVYKTMCGILIANSSLFIISIAIVINLGSNIVK